ncbi:MAG: hypothetical protein D6736_14840, partial [Nitrospinota bacterium]
MTTVRRSIEHYDPTFTDDLHTRIIPDRGEIAFRQSLLALTTDLTLMSVGAHPDDEDSGTLAYYRRKHGLRTITLLATRGEGGQNRLGPELNEELGVLRFHEARASSAIIDAEIYNLCLLDFGYSKSAEETFRHWGYEEALRRMVQAIRQLRPDIIITNHGPTGGHGQHQAVGQLLLEAFAVAADPTAFPEQLREWTPWQVKKLYLRTFKAEEATVAINIGEYDALRGCTYAEMALEALRQHRTQGVGRWTITKRPEYRYYRLVRSVFPTPEKEESLLDGLTPWRIDEDEQSPAEESIKGLHRVWSTLTASIDQALTGGTLSAQGMVEELLSVLDQIRHLREQKPVASLDVQELHRKEMRLLEAIRRGLGVFLSSYSEVKTLIPGQKYTVTLSLFNGGPLPLEAIRFALHTPPGWEVSFRQQQFSQLQPQEAIETTATVSVPRDAPFTVPHTRFLYDQSLENPLLEGIATFSVLGTSLTTQSPLWVDVAPPASLTLFPPHPILPLPLEGEARMSQAAVPLKKKLVLRVRYNDQNPGESRMRLV